ncbi:S-adenosyl-L-methionine-dependent methyltransferase [Syncephalis fuscata]|nr:S-adenosyl-L-methionine-dependent methyltransferase [Syncephalis fuscata]
MTTHTELSHRFPGTNRGPRGKICIGTATKGNPESVYETIERFAREDEWLIILGKEKSAFIDELITTNKPSVVFELGAYCGYSAVRFGSLLKKCNPNAKYYSFEADPHFYEISKTVIEYSGLSDVVEITLGPFNESLSTFLETHPEVKHVDLAFIDHAKELYNLLVKGSIVAADNILYPGAPEYHAYVTDNPDYDTTLMKAMTMFKVEDAVAVSVKK